MPSVMYGEMDMHSERKKVNRSPTNRYPKSSASYNHEENRLNKILEKSSLKDIPLKERRREAKKPLYLLRYE
jgi:hypothetical protein